MFSVTRDRRATSHVSRSDAVEHVKDAHAFEPQHKAYDNPLNLFRVSGLPRLAGVMAKAGKEM